MTGLLDGGDRRKGNQKALARAAREARIVACIDHLMVLGDSVRDACASIAAEAGDETLTAARLLHLRKNLRRGKARPEAIEAYRYWLQGGEDGHGEDFSPPHNADEAARRSRSILNYVRSIRAE